MIKLCNNYIIDRKIQIFDNFREYEPLKSYYDKLIEKFKILKNYTFSSFNYVIHVLFSRFSHLLDNSYKRNISRLSVLNSMIFAKKSLQSEQVFFPFSMGWKLFT